MSDTQKPAPLADMCPKCGSTNKVWMERSLNGRSKCECGFEGKHTEWIKAQRVLDKVNALIQKPAPLQFWVELYPNLSGYAHHSPSIADGMTDRPIVHVIEAEPVLERIRELEAKLEKANVLVDALKEIQNGNGCPGDTMTCICDGIAFKALRQWAEVTKE